MKNRIKFELFKLIGLNFLWLAFFSYIIMWVDDVDILRMFGIVTFFLLCISQVIFNICTNPLFKGEYK